MRRFTTFFLRGDYHIYFTLVFCLLCFQSVAQQKSDFHYITIKKETWSPIKGLVDGKYTPSFLKVGSFDPKADSLAIMKEILTAKVEQDTVGNTQQHEQIQGVTHQGQEWVADVQGISSIGDSLQKKKKALPFGTGGLGNQIPFAPNKNDEDSLTFARIYDKNDQDIKPINFTVRRSIMREDTTNLYDVQFENIVTVSEELSIDCVWVTLTKYYAVWNSEQINPYRYDISNFKKSIPIQLYDTTKKQEWSMPLAKIHVTSMFGFRRNRWHHGIDLNLDAGDPVYATFDGIVRISRYNRNGYGNFVVLRHYNGLETLYGHLSKLNVKVGQFVKSGEEIGKGGSTGRSSGPHLHYEVRYRGYAFDPREIYDFHNKRMKMSLFRLKPSHFSHLKKQRQTVWHTTQDGETLYKIALRYRTTVYSLCKLNGLTSKSSLKAGQKLRIK